MRHVIITFLTAVAALAATTTVQQTVNGPDGLPAGGTVTIQLTAACRNGSSMVGDRLLTVKFAAGAFSTSLVPTDACVTSGSSVGTAWSSVTAYAVAARVVYGAAVFQAAAASTNVIPGSDKTKWVQISPTYTVKWTLITGSEWTESWAVPTSGSPITVDAVRIGSPVLPTLVLGLPSTGVPGVVGTVMYVAPTGDAGAAITTAFVTANVVEVVGGNATATTLITIPSAATGLTGIAGTLRIMGKGTLTVSGIRFADSTTVTTQSGTLECPDGATIKLANSANVDLVSNTHFSSLTGTGSIYGAWRPIIRGCVLDGNKANQSSGFGVRLFGRAMRIDGGVVIQNAKQDGLYLEGTQDSFFASENSDLEAIVSDVKTILNGGNGYSLHGPNDIRIAAGISWGNGGWGIEVARSAQLSGFNTYLNISGGCHVTGDSMSGSGIACTNDRGWGLLIDSAAGASEMSGNFGCNNCVGVEVRSPNQVISGVLVNSAVGLKFNGGSGLFHFSSFGNATVFNCASINGPAIVDSFSLDGGQVIWDAGTCGSATAPPATGLWRWGHPGNAGVQQGGLQLQNNVPLYGINTTGTKDGILRIDNGNNIAVGDIGGTLGVPLMYVYMAGRPVAVWNTGGSLFSLTPGTAIAGTNVNSVGSYYLQGSYWDGAAAQLDSYSWQNIIGTGTNPKTTLTLAHSGTSGAVEMSLPASVIRTPTATIARVLFSAFSSTDTVSCPSNVTTAFATSYTLPANALTANKLLRVTIGAALTSSASPPSMAFKLYIGGTQVYAATPGSPNASLAGVTGGTTFLIQGTAAVGASVGVYTSPLSYAAEVSNHGTPFNAGTIAQPVNLATNGALVIQPEFFCSASTAGNSLTLNQMVVEAIN
jgi:hypothetical protein